jgi:hypothetical protein
MSVKMRRNFSGEFLPHDLGRGAWRLSAEPSGVDILLHGAGAGAAQAFGAKPIGDLSIEWQDEGALLRFSSAGRIETLHAAGAIVHEPLSGLYAGLPLSSFDEPSRRFWKRVFLAVRLPGGKQLLKFLTRSA